MEIIVGINQSSFVVDGVEVRTIYTLSPCRGSGFQSDHAYLPVRYDDCVRVGDVVLLSCNGLIVDCIEHVSELDTDILDLSDKFRDCRPLIYHE